MNSLSFVIFAGPMEGKRFSVNLDIKDQFTIGRAADSDICIAEDILVSRNHAIAKIHDKKLLISDTNSKNGTFIKGERIKSSGQLSAGETITLGHTVLKFIGFSSLDNVKK